MIIALQTLIYFRESLLNALNRFLEPAYKRFALTRVRQNESEEEDEEVSADFDDEKGVVFYPPMYAQRYAAVTDCLMDERWNGKLEKVVDLGYHDMSFIKYLKEIPGVKCIMGVDIESMPLRCSSDLLYEDYGPRREDPLQITLFQGNAADPDYRLIGCDAVIAIEMIEHMLPHDLDRLVHTIFGFIKPWVVIITTPNGDFNVLFKSLERNGLRRLDHFFEWSREQFNDWCSNIVSRYPNFTVSCKGVGPGPPGTSHLGCCSQLALFVNENYEKQKDLNIDSLALVRSVPSRVSLDLVHGWDTPATDASPGLVPQTDESLSQLNEIIYSTAQSCMTIVIAPTFSEENLEYRDNTSQCNLDMENKRNFLMFDDENMCLSIMAPRKRFENRVYVIEDVASRLNCTTLQVTKFSKTTQHLMAKNKMDSLMHTREVVDEIRHLTNMLNFNKDDTVTEQNGFIWYNINWGANAPYWNQYYKVVRAYNYPYETKSEDCRILDLVTEEITRLSDVQYVENSSMGRSILEIPISRLIDVVSHITNDKDRVKDLLEWNGYEVVGDTVVHNRLVVDRVSDVTDDDWPDIDSPSDLESSDIISSTNSSRSNSGPDLHARDLRRALDKKVRKLKAMQSSSEDITSVLEKVVCRLMKLALHTFKTQQTPPPTRWMQCKLFDLLTLTERAIVRRNKYYIDNYGMGPIDMIAQENDRKRKEAMKKIEDEKMKIELDDYHLDLSESIESNERKIKNDLQSFMNDAFFEKNYNDNSFFKDFQLTNETVSSELPSSECIAEPPSNLYGGDEGKQYEMVAYRCSKERATLRTNDFCTSAVRYKCKKIRARISKERLLYEKEKSKHEESSKRVRKLSSHEITSLRKIHKSKAIFDDYGKIKLKSKSSSREHKKLQSKVSKPIPGSLIELCHPELNIQKNDGLSFESALYKSWQNAPVSATATCQIIEIISEAGQETISMQRTSVGTHPWERKDLGAENETDVNVAKNYGYNYGLENGNVDEQTIFLNDINEPSTSKGVRHVSMDVQCSPITTAHVLSPATSFTKLPDMFSTSLKIDDSLNNLATNKNLTFGHSIQCDKKCMEIVNEKLKKNLKTPAKGIKIEDSLSNLDLKQKESDTFKNFNKLIGSISPIIKSPSASEIDEIRFESRKLSSSSTDLRSCNFFGSPVSKNRVYDFKTTIPKTPLPKMLFIQDSDTKINGTDCTEVNKNERSDLKKAESKKESTQLGKNIIQNYHLHNSTDYQDKDSTSKISNQEPKYQEIESIYVEESTESKIPCLIPSDYCPPPPQEDIFFKYLHNDSEYTNTMYKTESSTTSCSKGTSCNKLENEVEQEIKSPRNTSHLNLSCGGIRINSIKDKDTTEDIVYQGEWERLSPKRIFSPLKANQKKKFLSKNYKITKKESKSSIKKEFKKFTNKDVKKPIETQRSKLKIIKQQIQSKSQNLVMIQNANSNKTGRQKSSPKGPEKHPIKLNEILNETSGGSIKGAKNLKSTTASKIPRIMKVRSRPSRQFGSSKEGNKIQNKRSKNYLPSYLIRRKKMAMKKSKQDLLDVSKSKTLINISPDTTVTVPTNDQVSYINNYNDTDDPTSANESTNKKSSVNKENKKRPQTKQKSPDRELLSNNTKPETCFKEQSAVCKSDGQNSQINSIHNVSTPNKKKKSFDTNNRNLNKLSEENKENIADPTHELVKKDLTKNMKISFTGTKQNVFMAHLPDNSLTIDSIPKSKPNTSHISNMKAASTNSKDEEKKTSSDGCSSSNNNIENLEDNSCDAILNDIFESSINHSTPISKNTDSKKHIKEVKIPMAESSVSEKKSKISVSICEMDYLRSEDTSSPVSFKTVITNDDSSSCADMEDALNRSFGDSSVDDSLPSFYGEMKDASENHSCKSTLRLVTPEGRSRLCSQNVNPTSFRNIFDRCNPQMNQNPPGVLASQVISGFSVNESLVAGDHQREMLRLVDSETGSYTVVERMRQAESEEVFVSGREDPHAYCCTDDDVVFPDWLFNILSHHPQSAVEDGSENIVAPFPVPIQEPVGEPLFEVNGNAIDTNIGGAGDGHGMHSDDSEGSSGQGSSLSSSDASSRHQSESTLICSSALAMQFEVLLDNLPEVIATTVAPRNETANHPRTVTETGEPAEVSSNRPESGTSHRHRMPTAPSDIEADVSSLDTDVQSDDI